MGSHKLIENNIRATPNVIILLLITVDLTLKFFIIYLTLMKHNLYILSDPCSNSLDGNLSIYFKYFL